MCIVGVSTKLFFGTDGIPPVISYSFYMIMGYVAAFGGTTFLRLLPKFGLRLLVAGLSLHPSLYLLNLLSPLPRPPFLFDTPVLFSSLFLASLIRFYFKQSITFICRRTLIYGWNLFPALRHSPLQSPSMAPLRGCRLYPPLLLHHRLCHPYC